MIIVFITTGIFFIVFEALVVCRNLWSGCSVWVWIKESLVALALASAIAGCLALDAHINEDTWNNGICECGGEFELVSVAKSRMGSESFYYACEDCGHTIETSAAMK